MPRYTGSSNHRRLCPPYGAHQRVLRCSNRRELPGLRCPGRRAKLGWAEGLGAPAERVFSHTAALRVSAHNSTDGLSC